MAISQFIELRLRLRSALLLAGLCATVAADMASTYTLFALPDYEKADQMQIMFAPTSATSAANILGVIPLTSNLGLNESSVARTAVDITGNVVAVDASNYASVSGSSVIPYLSCDANNSSFIGPNQVLNNLMANVPAPKAILLYSQSGESCGLSGNNLAYTTILAMASRAEALVALNLTTTSNGTAQATIAGNMTSTTSSTPTASVTASPGGIFGGNNSAVAMSILYSITGLITLLFLIIICTGAIRAHRFPERYGPQAGIGRARQSRAKGIARAVLETLPIVKFTPKTTDETVELETGVGKPNDASANTLAVSAESGAESSLGRAGSSDAGIASTHPTNNDAGAEALHDHSTSAIDSAHTAGAKPHDDDHLGCSICTEDFQAGEDVRVLPCNHKFHPACVDPWLTNVSGTCPLCRLDLRPVEDRQQESTTNGEEAPLPPPLEADHAADAAPDAAPAEGAGSRTTAPSAANNRRRVSRIFDVQRLRNATSEERIAALRQYRSQRQEQQRRLDPWVQHPTDALGTGDAQIRARLAARLRERFHIRTRAQPIAQEGTPSSSTATEPAAASTRDVGAGDSAA